MSKLFVAPNFETAVCGGQSPIFCNWHTFHFLPDARLNWFPFSYICLSVSHSAILQALTDGSHESHGSFLAKQNKHLRTKSIRQFTAENKRILSLAKNWKLKLWKIIFVPNEMTTMRCSLSCSARARARAWDQLQESEGGDFLSKHLIYKFKLATSTQCQTGI